MKKALQNCITGKKALMALLVFTFISIAIVNPVNGQITVTFSQPDGLEDCQGVSRGLDAFASGGSGIYTDYEWIDPDNVIRPGFGSSVIIDFINPGTYSIQVIVTDD